MLMLLDTHPDTFRKLYNSSFGRLVHGQYTVGQPGYRPNVDHRRIFVDFIRDVFDT